GNRPHMKWNWVSLLALSAALASIGFAGAQSAKTGAQPPNSAESQANVGLSLAESGKCPDALTHFKKINTRSLTDDLKKRVGAAGVRCAMLLNQQDDAIEFLRALRRDFPRDPEVQFLSVHVFSDLSIRASQDLLFTNPGSYQVHQLNAEVLETQGRWDDALSEYRAVL